MMLMHQLVAFCLYSAPLYYMWEKLLHVHSKSLWLRIPLRLPVALFVWFLAIAFPFYGNINSIIGAINSPAIALIFPCLAYSWVYRTPQARASCTLLPPNFMRKWDWAPIFVLNLFIVLWFLVNGVGFGIAYSTIQIVDDVKTFHVFAECYQCPAKSALSGSG